MKRLNKNIVVLLTFLMLSVVPMKAQVFIMDDEFEGVLRHGESEFVLVAPNEGHDGDQYVPIGEGVLLLTTLGGAYLLTKRKKSDRQ